MFDAISLIVSSLRMVQDHLGWFRLYDGRVLVVPSVRLPKAERRNAR